MIDIKNAEEHTQRLISDLIEKCDCETLDDMDNVLQILMIKTKESLDKIDSNKPFLQQSYEASNAKVKVIH